jgi:hypothetical protein
MEELSSCEKKLVDVEIQVLSEVVKQGIESIVSELVASRNMDKTDSTLRAQVLAWCNETERMLRNIKSTPSSGKKQ